MTRNSLGLSEFVKALNTEFRIHPEEGRILEVELVEAVDEIAEGGKKKLQPGHELFSLVFRGGHESPLPQRIYQLDHDDIGSFELFLVPINQDEGGVHYQAVFNLLKKPE